IVVPENEGKSWLDPLPSIDAGIAAAVDAVADGAPFCQVWIKNGVYKPAAPIRLAEDVHLYGAFAGVEQQLVQRDLIMNLTAVDGETDIDNLFIGAPFSQLHNLTVQNNTNDGTSSNYGAGIYIEDVDDMLINYVTFKNNKVRGQDTTSRGYSGRGGAVSIINSAVVFNHCLFSENEAIGGKDLYIGSNDDDGYGGAIYAEDSEVTITNSLFNANISYSDSDDGYGRGGAICLVRSGGYIINSLFYDNIAQHFGAALYGREESYFYVIHTTVFNNDLQDNGDDGGAGLHVYDNTVADVYNSIFWENDGIEMKNSSNNDDIAVYSTIVQDGDFSGDDFILDRILKDEPLFVNVPNKNFHHAASSPALDYGDKIDEPKEDMDGKKRNLTTPDLGCYER
ncbi:hypothetical protein KAH37_10520, partial [bacterium]|nr:hypothetical protein [bacterium]